MARVKHFGPGSLTRWGGGVALVLLSVAFVMNTVASYLVVKDHGLVDRWLRYPGQTPESVVLMLEREFDLRIASRLIVSMILIFSAMVILAIQRALRRFHVLAADVFARMEKGVIAVDRRGTITVLDRAAARILMVENDHVGGPLSSISSVDAPLAEMVASIRGGDTSGCERDLVLQRGGRARRIQASASVLEDAAGEQVGTIVMLNDVTQRYLDEQRLRRIERFHSTEMLASGLIHEIGNPLAALGIHIKLLEERLAEPGGVDSAVELIEVLKVEIERLDHVLVEFRDYADMESLSMEPTDLIGALERVARLIRPQAERQGVRVELRPPDLPLPPVPLDAEKFAQSLLNLAINALEAMPAGGTLVFAAAVRDQSVEIEVTDSGCGIAPEVREDLFKPFVTTKPRGTGLGLALTEKLVVLQQGQIDYRTGPGGTSFLVTFPLAMGEHAP